MGREWRIKKAPTLNPCFHGTCIVKGTITVEHKHCKQVNYTACDLVRGVVRTQAEKKEGSCICLGVGRKPEILHRRLGKTHGEYEWRLSRDEHLSSKFCVFIYLLLLEKHRYVLAFSPSDQ